MMHGTYSTVLYGIQCAVFEGEVKDFNEMLPAALVSSHFTIGKFHTHIKGSGL